jgi:hypothetical protein
MQRLGLLGPLMRFYRWAVTASAEPARTPRPHGPAGRVALP